MDSPIVLSSGESDDDDDVILVEDSGARAVVNLDDSDDDDVVFICVEESDSKGIKPLDLTGPVNKNLTQNDQKMDQTDGTTEDDVQITRESMVDQTAEDNKRVATLNDQVTSNTTSKSDDSVTDKNLNLVSSNESLHANNCHSAMLADQNSNRADTLCIDHMGNLRSLPSTSNDKLVCGINNNNQANVNLSSSGCSFQPGGSYNASYDVSDLLSLTSDILDTHAQTPISQDFNISKNIVSNYITYSPAIDNKNVPPRKRLKTESIVSGAGAGDLSNELNRNYLSFTQFLASEDDPSRPGYEHPWNVCCVCETLGLNMSSCTEGHHTCASCLEVSVKFILCQREKPTSLKCQFIGCNSFFLTSQLKRTMPSMVVEILEKHMEQNCFTIVEDEIPESNKEFPDNWVEMSPKEPFTMVKLQPGTDDYVMVAHEFHKTLPFGLTDIEEIYRVQNPIMWKFFSVKKEQMMSDTGETMEKFLFHGTSPNSIEAICRSGFDWRLSGVNGTYYGKGSYFAEAAKYSHQYSAKGSITSWKNNVRNMLTARLSASMVRPNTGIPPTTTQTMSSQPTISTYPSPLNLSTVVNGVTSAPPNISIPATAPPAHQNLSLRLGRIKRKQKGCSPGTAPFYPWCLPVSAFSVPSSSSSMPVLKMFLARVLVGQVTTGSSNLLKPPPIDPVNEPLGKCFDTCVDNEISPKIYVVFDIAQAYPEYVIHYKTLAPFS